MNAKAKDGRWMTMLKTNDSSKEPPKIENGSKAKN